MKTRAAVLRDMGKDWEVIEMDLDPPREGEVLIRFAAAGLCHSDDHLRTGDIPVRYPIVGGHEGAGVVEEVGAGVSRLKPGDHVVCSFLPTCGHCRFCAQGMTNLCDLGALFVDNCLPDGTFRFHADGEDFGQMCLLGTFSQRSVVSPSETAGLVNRHYHPQQVFAYTISGKWGYLEHDWVATAGDWVYEAPGESHTLVAYECDEPMRVTFNVTGPLIWLDENGEPNGAFDVFDYIALVRDHYEKNGIGADYIDQLMR